MICFTLRSHHQRPLHQVKRIADVNGHHQKSVALSSRHRSQEKAIHHANGLRLADMIIRSKTPPCQGALSKLNCHSMQTSPTNFFTSELISYGGLESLGIVRYHSGWCPTPRQLSYRKPDQGGWFLLHSNRVSSRSWQFATYQLSLCTLVKQSVVTSLQEGVGVIFLYRELLHTCGGNTVAE